MNSARSRYRGLRLASINHSSVVRIPANAQVVLVEGTVERDRFVRIRYERNVLLMLSEDLRRGIGFVPKRLSILTKTAEISTDAIRIQPAY